MQKKSSKKNYQNLNGNSAVLFVDLRKIAQNWHKYQALTNNCQVSCVIKSNGYASGSVAVHRALLKAGCKVFWVATVDEAIKLRLGVSNQKNTICVFEGISANNAELFFKYNLTGVINSLFQLQSWNDYSKIKTWIQFDTGMNRAGIKFCELDQALKIIQKYITDDKFKNIIGYMSHLVASEQSKNPINNKQKHFFDLILKKMPPAKASLSNSAGVFLGKGFHYDFIRVGIGLYGVGHGDNCQVKFEFPLTLKAPLISLQKASEGEGVGYNNIYTLDKDLTVGTLLIGYSDGLNLALSNKYCVKYNNLRLRVIGKVSMDAICIDISDALPIAERELITIFDCADDISKMAKITNTPPHNVLATLGSRIKRIYNW